MPKWNYAVQAQEKDNSYDKPRAARERIYGGKFVIRQAHCEPTPVTEHLEYHFAATLARQRNEKTRAEKTPVEQTKVRTCKHNPVPHRLGGHRLGSSTWWWTSE